MAGCDYKESFYLHHDSNRLVVTESVIDALSVATIIKEKQGSYKEYSFLALSGTNKLQAIFHHLEKEPVINTLILGLDSDEAGRIATDKIKEQLSEIGWKGRVIDYVPKIEKDWNAELQNSNDVFPPDCRSKDEIIKELESICDDGVNRKIAVSKDIKDIEL